VNKTKDAKYLGSCFDFCQCAGGVNGATPLCACCSGDKKWDRLLPLVLPSVARTGMLYADKRALETNLKVSLLAIREKELNYYTQNALAVGTQAALLAGFAYSGLTQVAIPLDSEYVLKLLYLLVTTTAMSLELLAVMNTTLLSMLGPGLALRGPDGSMHPAVDGMMEEYQAAYLNFVLGLIFFHFSAALFGWLMFNCAPPT
jgi:hypothetical protein